MDKKFVIEVHQGEDYFTFTVNGKEKQWSYEGGRTMWTLLEKFIKELKKD